MRVRTGVVRRAKHKKVLKAAKGYQGRRRSVYKLAKQAMLKAGQYSYRDRKVKKRVMRSAWIVKLNAAVRQFGMSYSVFIKKLTDAEITMDRKTLANLAENEPKAFEAIINKIK